MLEARHKGLIRGLIYPIQFENDPIEGVDRVLKVIVGARALDATPEQYAQAIRAALNSDEPLAELIPQPHPEVAIRTFLVEIQKRLAERD